MVGACLACLEKTGPVVGRGPQWGGWRWLPHGALPEVNLRWPLPMTPGLCLPGWGSSGKPLDVCRVEVALGLGSITR